MRSRHHQAPMRIAPIAGCTLAISLAGCAFLDRADDRAAQRLRAHDVRIVWDTQDRDRIVEVAISKQSPSPEVMSVLEGLPRLEFLSLVRAPLSLHSRDALAALRGLRGLVVFGDLTYADMQAITQLRRLEVVTLIESHATDTTTEGLERLTQLRDLRLRSRQLTDRTLARLGDAHELRRLDLTGWQVRGEAFDVLHRMPYLEVLLLSGCPVDEHVADLNGLRQLRELDLHGTNIRDDDLLALSDLPNLRRLVLSDTAITDRGLEALRGMSSLMDVSLDGTGVSDAGMATLARLLSLRHVDLAETSVGDAGLRALARLAQLESLDVGQSRVTDAGLAFLRDCPSLTEIRAQGGAVTIEGVRSLAGALDLRTIVFDGARDERWIAELPRLFPHYQPWPRHGTESFPDLRNSEYLAQR